MCLVGTAGTVASPVAAQDAKTVVGSAATADSVIVRAQTLQMYTFNPDRLMSVANIRASLGEE